MDDSLVAAVDQRAEKDGTSRSEIIRSAVRAFVA
ncbi:ribbon-helix-helix protein, CopG family [Actinomyces naeslundii]|nr:ribbon-helix-helix protein, CopG family [Actinomyces naeslundii]